jgi:putative peptidoglycan binding protein
MRIFGILICSLALVSVAYGAQQEGNKQKKKQPQAVQHAPPSTTGHPRGAGAGPKKISTGSNQPKSTNQLRKKKEEYVQRQENEKVSEGEKHTKETDQSREKKEKYVHEQENKVKGKTSRGPLDGQTAEPGGREKVTGAGKPAHVATTPTTAAGKTVAAGKPFKPQHFNVAKQPDTAKAPAVKFQQGRHIEGSEHWQGQQYAAFRNYHSEWHDQGWWHNHYHNNITFVFGAPYYFNAGYWFPAWGYYPNAYYAWDGPIYAYHHLPPDQVIANVQATLQQQGYYHGDVDGLAGPLTRAALADYQRDHGLYETAAIDRPTLESLGMT